jgi:hypothetical protein
MDYSIEDCFRSLAEFGGIHSFNFDDEFEDDGADANSWDVAGAQGTWIAGTNIQGTGDGAGSTLYGIHSIDDMPKSFVLQATYFDNANHRGAIGILATDESNCTWVRWNSTQVLIQSEDTGTLTSCMVLPKAYVGDRVVTISVYPDEEETQGCYVSCWFDEEFVINAHLATYPEGRKLALGTYEAEVTKYDDFRIAELTELLPVATIDVGETPLGALKRAIGRRHINYHVRWNGELRAWRPKAVATAMSVPTTVYVHDEEIDRRGVISHWRQVGAKDTADAYDNTLLQAVGHRFHLDENPDLMTEDDCAAEASYNLNEVKEYTHTASVDLPMDVFLEPEDRVTIRSADWLLSRYGITLQAGALLMQASLREYVY